MGPTERPPRVVLTAAALGIFGAATISAVSVAFVLSVAKGPPWMSALALLHGLLAIATAALLWQGRGLARWTFLLWCLGSTVAPVAAPEARSAAAIPAYILTFVCFYLGYASINGYVGGSGRRNP